MYKVIGGDQKEYGPVSAEEIVLWIKDGRLSQASLVRLEGSNEWRSLGALAEFAPALSAQASSHPLPPPASTGVSVPGFSEQALAATADISIGDCIGRGLALVGSNFGLLYAAALQVWLISVLAMFVPFGVGQLAFFVCKGALYGGLYLVFLRKIRGEPTSVSEVFAGFQTNFMQLMLAGVVSGLLVFIARTPCCLVLPGLYLFVSWLFAIPLVADRGLEFWSAMELSRKVIGKVWFPMLGLVFLVFLPFVVTYIIVQARIGMEFVPLLKEAMNNTQPDFNRMLQMGMKMAKENLIPLMVLKVVWAVNWPVAIGALMYAYEDLFGTRKSHGS